MSEQWFLDLDGVRSGPYQTSEVMSLVAEGEILPHHLISTDLKAQKWTTILEWRLSQNRTSEFKAEAKSFSPANEKPVVAEKPAVAEKPVTPEKVVVAEKPKPIEPERAATPPAAPSPVTPPPVETSAAPITTGKPKRDPMAEMFDMLQNQKQKREEKSQQAHQAHAHHHHSHNAPSSLSPNVPSSGGSWGKTILVGSLITIVGFALGQFFQHQSQKQPEPAPVVKSSATPLPSTGDTPMKVTDETGREVMEVKTDKMTIRAPVRKEDEKPEANKNGEHSKDVQELKDLKKELMELKALKEEIRGGGNNDVIDRNGRVEPGRNKTIDDFEMEPESMPEQPMDEEGRPINPNGHNSEDVHY